MAQKGKCERDGGCDPCKASPSQQYRKYGHIVLYISQYNKQHTKKQNGQTEASDK